MAEKHPLEGAEQLIDTEQKRLKLETENTVATTGSQDPHNASASRVVHARAVPDGCNHQQMVATLTKYGKISYLTMMPRMRQALVEFEKLEDAIQCVKTCQMTQVYILDRPVFFNYSTSQEITRSPYGVIPNAAITPGSEIAVGDIQAMDQNELPSNHILLFTIFNPLYPITVDVVRTICTPYGFVQRIVIFRKNGLQVLVEFESNASAQRAKGQLDGADIYAGCCTLKIEYAKTTKLNVYKNDEMTWDFTSQGRTLQQTYRTGGSAMQQQVRGFAPNFGLNPTPMIPKMPTPNPQQPYSVVGTAAMANSGGSVVMLYGLTHGKHNCEHVFNLLCSYANVLKVKILANKPGTAMAHIDNPGGAKNAIHHLHGHKLLGQTLELNHSRHSYIADYSQGGTLPDGQPCWKDFSQSRNNRFLTAEGTSKNRIVSPGTILHFYNSPPDSSVESLNEIFTKVEVSLPVGVKFFQQGPSCKSATGLMEWPTVDQALDAFVMGNHQTAFTQTSQAYTFKLAFSSNTSLESGEQQQQQPFTASA